MKKTIVLLLAMLCGELAVQAAKAKVSVDRIDPPTWFVGIKSIPSVQLMVYGQGIRDAEVTIDRSDVTIDSLVRLDSPNYLLIYMNTVNAQPGTVKLNFKLGKFKKTMNYELLAREMSGDRRMGFTNADVLYMLMPDRFADGDQANNQIAGMRKYVCDRKAPSLRHGGDIEGIRKHLDYFNDLGVTALWFTPVLENDSPDGATHSTYHGYATTDYYRVDPRFGTNAEYRRLTDEAHQHGLKIVMDMIFNHCGFDHPWVSDLPAKDWLNLSEWLNERKDKSKNDPRGTSYLQTSYKLTPIMDDYASEVDLKETVEGWFVPGMPDLNQHNVHVMNYLIQNSVWWIETVGIDGIRMDTYPYAYADGMARWMKVLDTEYPNFNVVGETWVTEPGYTAAWQKGNKVGKDESYLKTVMDFTFFDRVTAARGEETDGWWNGYNRVYNGLVYDYLYPHPEYVMAFIENHDTDRFLGKGKDAATLKQALALLLTLKRTPQLYYGTEVLMNGTKERTDGDVRRDFVGGFPGDERNCFTREGRTQEENDMYDWLKAVLHWRQGNDVIIKGKQTQFIPYGGVYVVARRYGGKTVMTVLNGSKQSKTMSVQRYAEVIGDVKAARDVPTGRTIDLSGDVKLAPRETLILEF